MYELCYDRMFVSCAILDGQPFAKIEEPPIVALWTMLVLKSLEDKAMMIVSTSGVLEFWLMR